MNVKRKSLPDFSFHLKRKTLYKTFTVLITVEDHKSWSVVWRSRELAKILFTYFDYSNSLSDELAWSIHIHTIEQPCVVIHPDWCNDYLSSLLF